MSIYKKSILIILFFNSCVSLTNETIDHHVIFSLQNSAHTQKKRHAQNDAIYKATHEIGNVCKKYNHTNVSKNNFYSRKKEQVFFIHFDHTFHSWTLYRPSYITYKDFVALCKTMYKKYGLHVDAYQDNVIISNKGIHATSLTLQELEMFKKMSEQDFENKIKKSSNEGEVDTLKSIQSMQKYFFWHLTIPTTGLLRDDRFDIEEKYTPLAWKFSLWDLAPNKGKGAKIAIIDTGASAFNIFDEEFSNHYKKNVNITLPNDLQSYGYNLVSENGLDPIQQIAINFGHYCDQLKFDIDDLVKKLPKWIIDFIKTKNDASIRNYFIKYAKKEYLNAKKENLNKSGEEVLKDLLYGDHGVIQSDNEDFFHIVHLDKPYDQDVLLETLPAPRIDNNSIFSAGHGTFTQGIVHGQLYNDQGITGLAPQADVFMIKAFKDQGTTNKSTLQAALQRAINLQCSVVSMSLKITDEYDPVSDAPLKDLVDSIDYVVAASGNDGDTDALAFKEAYPAKFDSVAFDVGAFAYDDGQYPMCRFTQKEKNIGPKFAAPGSNIFSAGLAPDQIEDSMYEFMTGTSIAVPVITGFLGLVLGEFQDTFTREQILKVLYKFSIKLNNQDDIWKNYVKVGTPDMRSALLCLHVLQALKKSLSSHHKNMNYNFDKNFDHLVQAIHTINYYIPKKYETILGYSFLQDFAHYAQASTSNTQTIHIPELKKTYKSIDECIDCIHDIILHELTIKKSFSIFTTYHKNQLKNLNDYVANDLFNKKCNLWQELSPQSQNRINLALHPRRICYIHEK